MDTTFAALVADAYEHLYDLVYLRTQLLTDVLAADSVQPRKERAWQAHRTLIAAIDELSPGPQAPVFSREWRRHRLMVLRYVDGLDPQAVSDQLAISRRHFYREHEAALAAISTILWQRYEANWQAVVTTVQAPLPHETAHVDLLRVEAERAAGVSTGAQLHVLLAAIEELLQALMHERQLTLIRDLPTDLPSVASDSTVLRQLLLGLLSYLIDHATQATLRVSAAHHDALVTLTFAIDPPEALLPATAAEATNRLQLIDEMAELCGARVRSWTAEMRTARMVLELPVSVQRLVLTVDDNHDILALLHRYLTPHNYRVVAAHTVADALVRAQELHPYAVIADVMMPERDGWDLLQALRHDPATCDIPVIICSVLRQHELALALGATACIDKPIAEHTLLRILADLHV